MALNIWSVFVFPTEAHVSDGLVKGDEYSE